MRSKGYIYVIRFGTRVKVGYSYRPDHRLQTLPYDEIIDVIPGCRAVEASFHTLLQPWQVCGEWFDTTSPKVLVLIREELRWYRQHPCRCSRCCVASAPHEPLTADYLTDMREERWQRDRQMRTYGAGPNTTPTAADRRRRKERDDDRTARLDRERLRRGVEPLFSLRSVS